MSAATDKWIFNLYPIYQTSDGRIYLTRGNSMGVRLGRRGDDPHAHER